MPAVMPMAVVLATAMAGLRLGRAAWIGTVAAFVVMLGGRFNPFGIADVAAPMMPESPTLALGAPTLVLLVTVLALRWRGETLRGAWVLVPLLALVSAGTKGSTSPLVVAGLGLTAAAMLIWNRPLVRRVLVDLGVVTLSLLVALVFVFHGSSAGLKLGIRGAADQTLLGTVLGDLPSRGLIVVAVGLTVLGGLSRAALAFALPFFRDSRADPLSWLLIGAAFAGAVAPGIFSHPGRSQGYFYLTAVPLAALGSALGLARLHRAWGSRRVTLLVLVGTVIGVALALVPPAVGQPLTGGSSGHVLTLVGVTLGVLVVGGLVAAVIAGVSGGRRRALRVAAAALATALVVGGASGAVTGWWRLGPTRCRPRRHCPSAAGERSPRARSTWPATSATTRRSTTWS